VPQRPRGITIDHVAQAAGVSKATVSKALNHPDGGDVAPETVEKITAVAHKLGYRSATQRPQLRNIGLVTGGNAPVGTGAFTGFLDAIVGSARANNLRVHLISVFSVPTDLVEERSRLRLSGVLVTDPIPPGLDTWLAEDGMPTVLINQYSHTAIDQVLPDDSQACRELANHLANAGHQRIAFVLRKRNTPHPSEQARLDAYLEWAAERKQEPLAIVSPTNEWIGRLNNISAAIVYNTDDAIMLLHLLKAAGKRVPKDIALVSFDDPKEARLVDPPLTGYHIKHETTARVAIERLIARIDGDRGASQTQLISGELHPRASSSH
jgi:LacI family transcriptional regulator